MYDHIGLKVKDLDSAVRFYKAALEPLGHLLAAQEATYAGLGPKDEPALWLYKDARTHGVHIAFRAGSREAVDRFHAAGLKGGGRDNGKPGLRADYGLNYYAAFLLDPDGNNVEAVCLR